MIKISEVYSKYKIFPKLGEHMFRVAAVATQICDAQMKMGKAIDKEIVVGACLLHDMGNIIKFKFGDIGGFFVEENIEYWEDVKKEFVKKYGIDEHEATIEICNELKVNLAVINVIKNIGFNNSTRNLSERKLENMIATYADQRVNPYGIVSLEGRVDEGHKRFFSRTGLDYAENKNFVTQVNALKEIEKIIFKDLEILPEDISDDSSREIISQFKNYEIN